MPDLAPEHTALLSSTAGVWSQAGAAHYAAGNTFLDAIAAAAASAGLPVTAVNFGPFRSVTLCYQRSTLDTAHGGCRSLLVDCAGSNCTAATVGSTRTCNQSSGCSVMVIVAADPARLEPSHLQLALTQLFGRIILHLALDGSRSNAHL